MARVPVSKLLRDILLRKNARACCVCKARNVGLNCHHIDGDSSNTTEANLAVLCVRDHDAHHRPEEYRPDATVNHCELDETTIRAAKAGWEAFVAETTNDPSSLLATACLYGSGDAIHSMTLAFHGADGHQVFQRVYHLIDGPPERWAEWAVGEVAWLGAQIKLALIDEPMPVAHCPSCTHGLTVATSAGFARRLASTTWESSSACSIYVNPEQASLAIRIEDDVGEAFSVAVHRCGAFLDVATSTYHERVPIAARPSVRTQTTKLVRKLLRDWSPSLIHIGTGPADAPHLIENLALPRHWEKPPK